MVNDKWVKHYLILLSITTMNSAYYARNARMECIDKKDFYKVYH